MRHRSKDLVTLAVHRFGLGARPGERKRVGRDPRGWLQHQLEVAEPLSPRLQDLPAHPELIATSRKHRETGERKASEQWGKQHHQVERLARFAHAVSTPHAFRERWVRFWSNHLCVSAKKRPVIALVGAHEREVIRRHDTGTFAELLLASIRHPAMLGYLDNQHSVGPESAIGRSKGLGLNENLARELLELHTLGVDGGYTQADVVALAEMLTGWTVPRARRHRGTQAITFHFDARSHQPGSKVFLQETYPPAGEAEAQHALQVLARHPATARHLARKLTIHFVADNPPEDIVNELTRVFMDTEGDLLAMGMFLIHSDKVWREAARSPKLRTPEELSIAMMRASGWTDDEPTIPQNIAKMETSAQAMGQPPMSPPSPAGWPDQHEDWAAPEQILRRVELAQQVGRSLQREVRRPVRWATDLLGERLHRETRRAMSHTHDRGTALAIALAAPEFQWR